MPTHRIPIRIVLVAICLVILAAPTHAVRIKDICDFEGIRDNHLMGVGLVTGLDGTGDDMGGEAVARFLRRYNLTLDIDDVKSENCALVTVIATLPPNKGQGTRIDVKVSALGDAENLHGGILQPAPLRPATASPNDPRAVYAVAAGAVSTGGFAARTRGGGASIVKNHPTSGLIPNGAIVEREVPTAFATKPEMVLQLRNPDFTTAHRIAQMINNTIGAGLATAKSTGAVSVKMPAGGAAERMAFMAEIEVLDVSPDSPARVVYNERTGTIVMGSNVRISTVIITHGNLIFEKHEDFLLRETTLLGKGWLQKDVDEFMKSELTVTEGDSKFKVIEEGVTIGEVAKGLNALGVTARDIIAILQALKAEGALQAELVAM